jgi:hypothetical protein
LKKGAKAMAKHKLTKFRQAFLLSFIFFAGIILIDCVSPGQSTLNYTHAQPVKIKNERLVNKSVDEVWDSLVKELSKSFFVINNIDKESRIVNVSFYTDSPEDFVDCGTVSHSWSGITNTGSTTYNSAEDSHFFHMAKWSKNYPLDIEVFRKTSLGCLFQRFRPPIPGEAGRLFRLKSAT